MDYYSILGVMPDTEAIVIVAAYRALASMYHPDRWKGDIVAATKRMADINVAYGVLSDAEKRKAYDATRSCSNSTFESGDAESDAAFDAALNDVETRWQIALEIFPDLSDIRKRLAKTAHRLAFAFVTVMLESKRFTERRQIADSMENSFLETYFGSDPEIVSFVRRLISAGHSDAVKAVNRYIDVLGSQIPANLIIGKVEREFNLNPTVLASLAKFSQVADKPESDEAFNAAWALAWVLGYQPLNSVRDGYGLNRNWKLVEHFATARDFVMWFKDRHC